MSKTSTGVGKLIPDRLVAERYTVTTRTLARWDAIPALNFPRAFFIRRRRYRSVEALDAWDRANTRKVTNPHNPHQAAAQTPPRVQRGRFAKPRDIEVR